MLYDPKKITRLREARKWSLTKLAKEANVSVTCIWNLENGRTKDVKHETMLAVSMALGVSVGEISSEVVPSSTIEQQRQKLVAIYGRLPDELKTALVSAATALLKSQDKPKPD